MKKFKTRLNIEFFVLFSILTIIVIAFWIVEGPPSTIRRNDPRNRIVLVILALFCSTSTIVFTEEHIIVRYLYIPVRRISVSRVNSIEFVMQKGEPYLVVCLDDHMPVSESHKKLKLFMTSSKMIVISVPDKKREEYVKEMKQLYSNVSFVNWE